MKEYCGNKQKDTISIIYCFIEETPDGKSLCTKKNCLELVILALDKTPKIKSFPKVMIKYPKNI